MARTGGGGGSSGGGCRSPRPLRNVKLDSFLKRNTERAVYERLRASEPCVVVSGARSRVYMHVVLSDERVYVTEFPPRALAEAVSFRRVRDIELVNDLPDFLRGRDRELCQHIRITYVSKKSSRKPRDWLRRAMRAELPSAAPPSRRASLALEGYPAQRNQIEPAEEEEEPVRFRATRSASCPNPETLGLLRAPAPPTPAPAPAPPPDQRRTGPAPGQVPRRFGSVLSRLLRRERVSSAEEKEAELHLYAVSPTSRLYFHLQSCWKSYIIRSTLLLEPLHGRRFSVSSDSSPTKPLPAISWERTAHLLGQLTSELLQDGLAVESCFLLLQELRTAAQRSVALRRLFWRHSELCVFLVQSLEESLLGEVRMADQLLMSTLIVQTLAIMFRETEIEASRLELLSARKGALASRMLLALVCDPELRTQSDCEALRTEHLDASCWLLSELLLLGQQASSCSFHDNFLSVGWILRVLQPHPHMLSFLGFQTQQVLLLLSDPQESVPGPAQCVLLFQRCCLLLAALQHSRPLAEHLRSHFGEEFRFSVKPSDATDKLPSHYPISRPTVQLVGRILTLILRR